MKRPRIQTRFLGLGDEMNHLNDWVLWLRVHGGFHHTAGRQMLERHRSLLDAAGLDDGSIMLQEHWAGYCEAVGNHARAATHRDRQVELIEALFRIGGPIPPIDNAYLERARQAAADDRGRGGETRKQGVSDPPATPV